MAKFFVHTRKSRSYYTMFCSICQVKSFDISDIPSFVRLFVVHTLSVEFHCKKIVKKLQKSSKGHLQKLFVVL